MTIAVAEEVEEIPAGLRQAREADASLPAQELCYLCAYEADHMEGVPRDVVALTVERVFADSTWDPAWGEPPSYDVTWLSCGHTIEEPHRF